MKNIITFFWNLLFGCSHRWYRFKHEATHIRITNGVDLSFTIAPEFCAVEGCKKVRFVREGN